MYQSLHTRKLPVFGGCYFPDSPYNRARQHWTEAPLWAKADQNIRALGTRRQTYLTIRMDEQDVVLRYHATDVLRFRPDHTIVLTLYPSVSTRGLVRRVLGSTVWCDYLPDGSHVLMLHPVMMDWSLGEWTAYRLRRDTVTLRVHCGAFENRAAPPAAKDRKYWGSYTVLDAERDTEPFRVVTVNRAVTGRAYDAHGLTAFQAWTRAVDAMNVAGGSIVSIPHNATQWLAMLQDTSQWPVLRMELRRVQARRSYSWWQSTPVGASTAPTDVAPLRQAVQRVTPGAFRETQYPTVSGWRGVRRVVASMKQMRRLTAAQDRKPLTTLIVEDVSCAS